MVERGDRKRVEFSSFFTQNNDLQGYIENNNKCDTKDEHST